MVAQRAVTKELGAYDMITTTADGRLVYLSPGLFDMGGIARYGRYQVIALRHLVGDGNVEVLSLLGPTANGFDAALPYDFAAGGNGVTHKVRYVIQAMRRARPHAVYWSGHLHLAPLAVGCAVVSNGVPVVNIYGLEIWSHPRRLDLAALSRCWVVADCHATLDHAVDHGLVDPARARVIWDPVDTSVLQPGSPAQSVLDRYGLVADGRFRVLFLGRLSHGARHKNPHGLIKAFAMARLPPTAELVIAGSGDRMPELEQLAHALGVSQQVRLIGRVSDADLVDIYRSASVFVLVSQKYDGGGEGIPLTPLEASACGIPIIVGNEDGSREAVDHEISGLLVQSRDPAELASLLERAAGAPRWLRQMGVRARERAERMFGYERFVAQHEEWLGQISRTMRARGDA